MQAAGRAEAFGGWQGAEQGAGWASMGARGPVRVLRPLPGWGVGRRLPGHATVLSLRMRYVASYLLAALGGNSSPSAKDIKKILDSVGIEADDDRLNKVRAPPGPDPPGTRH